MVSEAQGSEWAAPVRVSVALELVLVELGLVKVELELE